MNFFFFLFAVQQLYIQKITYYAMVKITKSKDYDLQLADLKVPAEMTSLICYKKLCPSIQLIYPKR